MSLEPALHLWINHLPIYLIVLGTALLLGGLIHETESYIFLGLICLVAAAALAALSYRTGPLLAATLGHDLQPQTETPASRHALYGFPATLTAILTGVFSLLALLMSRGEKRIERVWLGFVLLSAILSGLVNVMAYRTGKQLAHPVLLESALLDLERDTDHNCSNTRASLASTSSATG